MIMYATDPNQIVWPPDVLECVDVPLSTKEFLSTVGLPPFVADLSVEFAIFDGEWETLMIGEDGDDDIVIDHRGTVCLLKNEEGREALFINSSVATLSQYLFLISKFKELPDESVETFRLQLKQLRQSLEEIDSEAMADDRDHVWPMLLNDMDAMAF